MSGREARFLRKPVLPDFLFANFSYGDRHRFTGKAEE